MQQTEEMQLQSLGQENPLEKGTATHSSILACNIPQTEEPGRLQSVGSRRVRHDCYWAQTHTLIQQQTFFPLGFGTELQPKHYSFHSGPVLLHQGQVNNRDRRNPSRVAWKTVAKSNSELYMADKNFQSQSLSSIRLRLFSWNKNGDKIG